MHLGRMSLGACQKTRPLAGWHIKHCAPQGTDAEP